MSANLALSRSPVSLGRVLSFYRSLRRIPIVPIVLLGAVVLVVLVGILADVIALHDPTDQSLRSRLLPPI